MLKYLLQLLLLVFASTFVEQTSTGNILWGITPDNKWFMLMDRTWVRTEPPLEARKKMKKEFEDNKKNKNWLERVLDHE